MSVNTDHFIKVGFTRKEMFEMKSFRKKTRIVALLLALLMLACSSQVALAEDASGILSVRTITGMGWWGQRVIGVVLEFTEEVDAAGLTIEDFSIRDTSFNPYFDSGTPDDPKFMKDQVVIDVFTVSDPKLLLDNERPAAPGRYLAVMVEPSFLGGTKISVGGGMMSNPNPPTEITIHKDIFSTSGSKLAEASDVPLKMTGPAVVNRGVDQFIHGILENPSVGQPLNYHYRLPAGYDPGRKYPLVVYFNGNGQGYFPNVDNIGGQLICDGTPQFWFGEMDVQPPENVIFLAPQSTRTGQSTAVQAEQAAELIEIFSKQFSVDTRRIYGYSLSAGTGLGWWLVSNRPDLFAAFIQCSGTANNQAQANAVAEAEIPIWLYQGQYDHLFGSANIVASYERIVNAYKAKGLSDERINELIKITLVPDEGFEPQGEGLHTPSGPYAGQIPNLPGPRIDRHASMVPAFQNPETSKWLLSQIKSEDNNLKVTSNATIVKKGDYFDIAVSFAEETATNAVSVVLNYDQNKFEYAGNLGGDPSQDTYIEGVTYLTTDAGDGSVKMTIMIPGYKAKDLLSLRFRAKVDADIQNGDNLIAATADFAYRTSAGNKHLVSSSGSINITTAGNPGDTDGDGIVTLLDLSNVIDMFGVKIGDALWTEARFYDFNKNNEIDIADIVAVAKLIR